MRKAAAFSFALVLIVNGCGESGSGDGGGMTPAELDQACRDFCANDKQGPDCGPGQNKSAQACYESCLEEYNWEVTRDCPEGVECYQGAWCPDEWWAANYGCYLSVDCNDQFGDCDGLDTEYRECIDAFHEETPAWCAANCPEDELCGAVATGWGSRLCGLMLP